MKKYLCKFLSLGLMLNFVSCNFLRNIQLTPDFNADWDFINSVGGIKLGVPVKTDTGGWKIPIICNIAGTLKVTTAPNKMNSGLAVRKVNYSIEEDKLYVSLALNTPNENSSAQCPDLIIGQISPRTYEVIYRHGEQENPIGTLVLNP